ncbi:hypothetical protein RHSP_47723 [Rhizobium freirei PRF 81]|uniref:Uncharacterized protein n=1 Tax=Rhizobium freirei PRF 81 TaxID=363754 RepID=N6V1Q6_9HYPH|nr:hypothetical protein [Rhizobium freirei]ENN87820.1 hypothetical protein RHSP_47723 [Rhizobium freirei PRF 81]
MRWVISAIYSKGTLVADVATLGIFVDSSNVRKATGDLDGFAAAMGRVTNSSGATSRAFKTMNGEAKTTGGIVDKTAANVLKFGTSYGLAADKLRGGLMVLDARPNNGAHLSYASTMETQNAIAASANVQSTGDKDYDYFLAHRADFANDTGKGIADILLSATSFAVKGVANEKIPYVGEVGEWVGNWIESFSPAIMREKSAAQIKSDAQLAREMQSLSGQKNNPAVAEFAAEKISREDLLSQTVGFRESADRTFSQALGKFESVAGEFDVLLSASAGRAGSQLSELGNSYLDFYDKLRAGTAQIVDAQNFDKVLSKTAAQMPDDSELAEFSKNFKGVLGSITQDLTVANGLKTQHELSNRTQSVAVDPAKQIVFPQGGASANTLLPNISAFSRVSPLAIEMTSRQPIANSIGVQNSQKDELQSTQQATDALTKSSKANTEQAKVGIQTSAQSAAATDNVKSKVVTLKQSQDELQKSCAVQLAQMPQLTKAANDQAAAYRRVAEAQALQKLAGDIQFQQEQMGRSTIDQTVASTQKQYGLPVDMNSASANIIRYNEQLKYARELAGDFASTLVSGLRNGEGLWKSLGKAAISVLTKISDRLLNDVLNSLFQVNSAAAGGGGGGGILGGILGIFGFGGGSSGGKFDLATGANAPIPIARPFADGGYTGPGGKHEPAGIVHAGEVVWSQKDIARAGGVGVVEAMRLGRRGYADGGVVGKGGPQLVRAQPDAAVPVRRLRADNQNDASGSASGVHVTVGVSVDEDGNLKAYVKNVAQSEAQSSTRQGLNDFNQQLPDRVAQINRNPRRR